VEALFVKHGKQYKRYGYFEAVGMAFKNLKGVGEAVVQKGE
jgi:hypothetical protein